LKNNTKLKKIARNEQVDFLNIYNPLLSGFSNKTTDGVHLTEKGQIEMANLILKYLKIKHQ